MSYQIFMDMSADVAPDIIKEGNIGCVPMEYSLGETMHTSYGPEPVEFMKMFYDGQRNGDLTRTSQISPYKYVEFFHPYMEKGINCLYLSLSSGLTSTGQSAALAADQLKEEFPDLELKVLDTKSATCGIGLLLDRAVRNQKAGMSLEENYEALEAVIPKLRCTFMVQNLTYLHRGGRVSAATATVANVLDIKPILKIDEKGELVTINKKRGNKQTLNTLLQIFDNERVTEDNDDPLYVLDSDAAELSDYLYEEVKKRCPTKRIYRSCLTPVIGAHTGPGLAAVCHIGK